MRRVLLLTALFAFLSDTALPSSQPKRCQTELLPSVQTEVEFLSKNFVAGSTINTGSPKLDGIAEKALIAPHAVTTDHWDLDTFATHGFGYFRIDQKTDLARAINPVPSESSHGPFYDEKYEVPIRRGVESFILNHRDVFREKFEFEDVVALDSVFRENSRSSTFRPIRVAHIDFHQKASELIQVFLNRWRFTLGERFSSWDTFQIRKFFEANEVAMLNVWLPMNDSPADNTLFLASKEGLDLKTDATWYTAVRRNGDTFPASGLQENPKYNWYGNPSITKGQAIIFESAEVPHAAADWPANPGVPRRSIEVRVVLLKRKVPELFSQD